MNTIILLQVIIAFAMGIVSLMIVYKALNFYLKRTFKIDDLNTAFATLQAGILLSTSILVSSIIGPGINAIRFLNQIEVTFSTVSISIAYVVMFLIIGVLFSMFVVAGGILILFQLTKINEWEEIKKNNIASSIISAALIFGLSLIMKDHVVTVCEMLVPYPEVLNIR